MSPALVADGVCVRLGGHPVLDGFRLQLERGGIRALVGLNGAGKTTALRVLLGMLRPDAGRVLLDGQDIGTAQSRVWRAVGHLVETPAIYPELTARENVAHAARLHGADAVRAARRGDELAAALGMTDRWDTRVRRLSLGTRQKVGLIAALAHEPDVVILDEPTNGLDPLAVVAFRDVLRHAAAGGGAVLLTSHHFDELARVADEVDILHRGRVVGTVRPDGRDLERAFFATILAAEEREGIPA